MTIGIIGSGKIGGTLARLFARAGEEVAIANSRGPETLDDLVADLGVKARAVTVEEAVALGDVVFLAIPWRRREELPEGERFAGKVVVDAMNPYGAGGVIDVEPSTSSEEVAKLMPMARLVKAFNTIYYGRLAENGRPGAPLEEREVIFLAGDDEEARHVVSGLIEELGFAPYDTGSLAEGGRRQQPGSPIYNVRLTLTEVARRLPAA
ncbi:MAG TPA: NADPH-dependent F420 reductase [Gaiellaceae bacterium]